VVYVALLLARLARYDTVDEVGLISCGLVPFLGIAEGLPMAIAVEAEMLIVDSAPGAGDAYVAGKYQEHGHRLARESGVSPVTSCAVLHWRDGVRVS
jgi:hypothetical protein